LKFLWLKKPVVAASFLVLLWATWRIAVLSHDGIPAPWIHDEFSYLLGADTFAHGRLANPPIPLGRFFESPHILVRPTYASKYPPGQTMFLAFGQVVLGSPFYGVLIGNALMLFTVCLALYAWVRPRWALAVTAMLALCLSPHMYWTHSYWGGSLAAAGGALVLLAIGMYLKKQTPFAGAVFALGALLLFWTRPYEGGVLTLTLLIVFGKELWSKRRAGPVAVACLLFVAGIVWTGFYNKAITGSPFRMPYMEYESQYGVAPLFRFLPLRPEPAYSHPRIAVLEGRHGWETAFIYRPKLPLWIAFVTGLVLSFWVYFSLWPAALLAIVFPKTQHKSLHRKMLIVIGVFFLALAVETYHQEHYGAPVWAAVALMIAVWAEHAWSRRVRGLPVGAVLVLLALGTPPLIARTHTILPTSKYDTGPADWPGQRAALVNRLSTLGPRQLVIVRYPAPDWNFLEEWVYNGADINREKVIFAHDLGAEDNRSLLNYYHDCNAWLLTFDPSSQEARIQPYPVNPSIIH
jgi:hypothetical protein